MKTVNFIIDAFSEFPFFSFSISNSITIKCYIFGGFLVKTLERIIYVSHFHGKNLKC